MGVAKKKGGRIKKSGSKGYKPVQHVRNTESYFKKLEVVDYYLSHDINSAMEKFYSNLSPEAIVNKKKQVRKWKNQRPDIAKQCMTVNGGNSKKTRQTGLGLTLSEVGERIVVNWIKELRMSGAPVSYQMVSIKALQVARMFNVSTIFKASWTWMRSFLKRNLLSFRCKTREGQVTPGNAGDIQIKFRNEIWKLVKELNVKKIYNCDQTGVNFEYLPSKTVDNTGTKTVWIRSAGKTKERVTVMLLGDSDGKKYPCYLVVKTKPATHQEDREYNLKERQGFGPILWPQMQVLQNQLNCQIYANNSGWWNAGLSIKFLEYHFGSRPNIPNDPIILLWDDFSAHWTPAVTAKAKTLNIHLVKVPPKCTAVCQPADIAWNRPFKFRIRNSWVQFLQEQVVNKPAVNFQMSAPNRTDVFQWIHSLWNDLSSKTIQNGFWYLLVKPPERDNTDEDTSFDYEELVKRLCALKLAKPVASATARSDVVTRVLNNE